MIHAAQLSHWIWCRMSAVPVPIGELRQSTQSLMGRHATDTGTGACTHTSRFSGGGKTFNVLCSASDSGHSCVHVPVNHTYMMPDFIRHVTTMVSATVNSKPELTVRESRRLGLAFLMGTHERCGAASPVRCLCRAFAPLQRILHFLYARHPPAPESAAVSTSVAPSRLEDNLMLHIDIATPVLGSIDAILWQLMFYDGLVETSSGAILYLPNPSACCLAFEVASGATSTRVRSPMLLPQCVASATEETFCAAAGSLFKGMGTAHMDSTRSDGTAVLVVDPSGYTTCYDRLQYVCAALEVHSQQQGFPLDFPESHLELQSTPLAGGRCFALLLRYSELSNRQHHSFWSLWNFANVLYWELKQIHHRDSPIRQACMPDPKAEGETDQANKRKIKAEMVYFLCKTAAGI